MKRPPQFSVVIPSYNRSLELLEAINSIERQTTDDWECIVVDDGSTDNTAELIARRQSRDNRIKYIKINHSGVSAARNIGIERSSGKTICFLDSDDLYEPHTLSLFARAFEKYPDNTFAYGLYMDEPTEKVAPGTSTFQLTDVYPSLVFGNSISSVVAMMNEKDRLPFFREELQTAEDYQFALDLARERRGIRINRKLFHYNFGPQNKSTRYIANGTYIDSVMEIIDREMVTISNSSRKDSADINVLWGKRKNALLILAASFTNRMEEVKLLSKSIPSIEYDIWTDTRYVLYRLTDLEKRFQVARNLIYFLNSGSQIQSGPDSTKLLSSIIDAVYCGIRLLPFHRRVMKSLQFCVLDPTLLTLKQSVRALR